MNDTVILAPKPKRFEREPGFWAAPRPMGLALPAELEALAAPLRESWGEEFRVGGGDVGFAIDKALPPEGYRLQVDKTGALVEYSAPAGAFYALMTLRQLAAGGCAPCCRVEDEPELPLRGFMLDVGRGKVPTLDSLKGTVDLLASLKYNHFQLYMEGMCFAYPSFPEYWKDETPLTPEELTELSTYCKARFIDLTPCQNSLGHMAPWLARPELRYLAEKEEGMVVHGIPVPPTTLDCRNPASLDFVERLTDDLLPCFDAPCYNACLDEPFELGKGKNAAFADQVGEGALYVEYAAKLRDHLSAKGKTMMLWGDVIARHPQDAAALPEDVVILEWGYEAAHPFEKRAAALEKLGRPFCLCPGTSTWNAVTGITDNMLANVRAAASAAHAHGALGLLLTDWGNDGHLQYWPFSWPAIVLAGALAWNGAVLTEGELAAALNRFVFRDAADKLGAAVLDMGRYVRWEEFPLGCRTLADLPLSVGPLRGREKWERMLKIIVTLNSQLTPPEVGQPLARAAEHPKPLDLERADAWRGDLAARLAASRPACRDAALVMAELANALALVGALTHGRAALTEDRTDAALAQEVERIAEEHRRLWLARNRRGGMELGLGKLRAFAQALKGESVCPSF